MDRGLSLEDKVRNDWHFVGKESGTTIECPTTFTIRIQYLYGCITMVKLQNVHHIQLPCSLKNLIQFDNKQQVYTYNNIYHRHFI